MKRFSDFAETPKVLDGKKAKIEDVVDKEIQIIGYRIEKSKYSGKAEMCLTIQFEYPEQEGRYVLFTGSTVLLEQFEKYGEEIPSLRQSAKWISFSLYREEAGYSFIPVPDIQTMIMPCPAVSSV